MEHSTSRITHPVSTETALRVVADRRNRSVLRTLIEREGNDATLDGLVEHVRPENPPPETAGGADQILVDLHHRLLPSLEDAGLVEFDSRTGAVRYRPNECVEKLHRFVTTELE